MPDMQKIEDFQKILSEADASTVLELQKVLLEKIAILGSPAVSCTSCDNNSC